MTSRQPGGRAKASLSVSIFLGTLLVPLSAFAASIVIDARTGPETETAPVQHAATSGDLGVACGEAGMQLVAAESAGSISPVQKAALDALRPICVAQGMALPAAPAPLGATIAAAAAPPPAAPVTTVPTKANPGHDDDEGDHGRHVGDDDEEDDQDEDRDDDDVRHGGDDD